MLFRSGAAGAEQSFIGGWGNSSLWRVWSADRSASSEITIKHGDGPRWNGSAMWHAGNFAPESKMDKSGGTFTGHVAVNGNSLRSYGWNGVPNDGVIVLGDANSYIFKNGSNFTFANSAGGFTSTLSTGGSIWTSGNFDPASKINRTGDTVTGSLRVNAYLYTQAAAGHNLIRFRSEERRVGKECRSRWSPYH